MRERDEIFATTRKLGQVSDREAADMTQRNLEIPHLVQISALPNHC